MANSPSSVQLENARGPLPITCQELGEAPLSADATGEVPELGDLGDDDIIADGGTQIMTREPAFAAPAKSSPPPVPKAPSSLDALAATIPAKGKTAPAMASKFVAPSKAAAAKVPPAPATTPILELDSEDLEEEQRRIERTQPFDRANLFGAP
ncbi:MAG: hypothetical protein KF782_27685, partial [Labilithrix sp.]|nr:hypothetical protein [Labilithrix sp.]